MGRYKEALADANHILATEPSSRAALRVKSIKDLLQAKTDWSKGHEGADVTLLCTITPREHRQWKVSVPSPYTRPYPFGSA